MSYNATVYKIMIASPSDVPAERNIVKNVLAEWNVIHSEKFKLVLLPIGWDTHISPQMDEAPQTHINKKILKNCDLLVGVFWTKIGTPTEKYPSGTIEEIEEHIKDGKPVMLYFSTAPVRYESVDQEQYNKLIEFRDSCKNRGIYETYDSNQDFKDKLFRHIQIKINESEYFKIDERIDEVQLTSQNVTNVRLSSEAKTLLKEASQDYDGQILRLVFMGGMVIQTNQKGFGEGDSRERAKWEGALNELEREGLIEAQGYQKEVYKITSEGYKVADLITI